MAISYIEKGSGVHREIKQAGLRLVWSYKLSQWIYNLADESAIQAIIDNYDPIADAKIDKIVDIKCEAAKRAGDYLNFARKLWKETGNGPLVYDFMMVHRNLLQFMTPSAKGTDSEYEGMLAVQQACKGGIDAINALGDIGMVNSYDVKTDPAWPVGA